MAVSYATGAYRCILAKESKTIIDIVVLFVRSFHPVLPVAISLIDPSFSVGADLVVNPASCATYCDK